VGEENYPLAFVVFWEVDLALSGEDLKLGAGSPINGSLLTAACSMCVILPFF
jgi:hypothetical protein